MNAVQSPVGGGRRADRAMNADVRSRQITLRFVAALMGATLGFLVVSVALAEPAAGPAENHPVIPRQHAAKVHILAKEDWCTERLGGGVFEGVQLDGPITSLSLSDIQSRVTSSIVNESHPTYGTKWDNIASGKIDFNLGATAQNCTQLEGVRGQMEVEVWAWGPNADDYADQTTICSVASSSTIFRDADASDDHPGNDYDKIYVMLRFDQIPGTQQGQSQRARTINHEFGHVVGLKDYCVGGEPCTLTSVMHNPSEDHNYPTTFDVTGATAVANNTVPNP
jgi:hypothetical protein